MAQERKRLRRGCLLYAILFSVLVCGGGTIVLNAYAGSRTSQMKRDIAHLNSLGVPTTTEQWVASRPRIKQEENAADLYRRVLKGGDLHSEFQKLSGVFPGRTKGVDLSAPSPIFELADQIAQRDSLSWNRSLENGWQTQMPEFASMKEFVKLLSFRAERISGKGDGVAAMRAIQPAFKIAEHAGDNDLVLGMLVQVALEAIAWRRVEVIMSSHGHSPAVQDELEKILRDISDLPSYREVLKSEVALARTAFERAESLSAFLGTPLIHLRIDGLLLDNKLVKASAEAKLISHWRYFFDRLPKDEKDFLGAHRASQDVIRRVEKDSSLENFVASALFPVIAETNLALAKAEAKRRQARIALRLHRTHPYNWPKSVTQFGDVGIDPLSGSSLRFESSNGTFKIWSVGQDFKDDGGVEGGAGKQDIVWPYKMPSK